MSKTNLRSRNLRATLLTGAATATVFAFGGAAFAQEANQPAAENVVVTGSRIPQAGYTSTSPIVTVSSQELTETGQVNVENVLNQLPQIAPSLDQTGNNPGGGQASLDLRHLGSNRTLVLVDGHRMMVSTQGGSVDVNNIPAEMIERIEVVTGGASSTYGSDAVAGVVNFILKHDFQGVEVNASYGISTRGDGRETNLSTLFGLNVGPANLEMDVSYFHREGIFQGDRSFSAIDQTGFGDFTPHPGIPEFIDGLVINGGSSRGTGSFVSNPANPNPKIASGVTLSNGDNCDFATGVTGSRTLVDTGVGVRGFCGAINSFGGDRYNYAPVNYMIVPQTRYSATMLGNIPIPMINGEGFIEGNFVNNVVTNQLAPSPLAASNNVGMFIKPGFPCDNGAFLSLATCNALHARAPSPNADAIVQRRMVEYGPRIATFTSNFFEIGGGLRGDIGDWKWEIYGQYGNVSFLSTVDDIARDRLWAEFNNCQDRFGNPDPFLAPGCVPQSPFTTQSPAAVNYALLANLTDRTLITRQNIVAHIGGDLWQLPAGAVSADVGVEYRRDASSFVPDSQKVAGNIVGFNAANPVSGAYDVKEGFGEVKIPVVKDTWIHLWDFDAGVRFSDYSSVGNQTTWKLGTNIEPLGSDELRFRAMYEVATRAPSVFELFATPQQGFPAYTDPCAANHFGTPPPGTFARCYTTGPTGVDGNPIPTVTPTYLAANSQLEAFFIGNPSLKAETADTLTLGAVWRPESFIPGLAVTVDYYHVKLKGAVASQFGGVQNTINDCFRNGLAAACALLTRDASGDLVLGDSLLGKGLSLANLDTIRTSGLDFSVLYSFPLDDMSNDLPGSLSFDLEATRLLKWNQTDPFSGSFNCDARVLCQNAFGANPRWKGSLRTTWTDQPIGLTLSWRMRYHSALTRVTNKFGNYVKAPSVLYHEAFIGYDVTDKVSLNFTVSNIFDKKPPLLYFGAVQSNTDPSDYDVIGRYFRFGVNVKL